MRRHHPGEVLRVFQVEEGAWAKDLRQESSWHLLKAHEAGISQGRQRMKEGKAGQQSEARTRTFETRLTRTWNLIPKVLGAMKEIKVSLFELIQEFSKTITLAIRSGRKMDS